MGAATIAALEARMHEIARLVPHLAGKEEEWQRHMLASATLSDWQVKRAVALSDDMWLADAIVQASREEEPLAPRPAVLDVIPGPDLAPEALPSIPEIPPAQRILNAIRQALTYSVVVEYLGHRDDPPVPIGVIVLCPGLHVAKAWFYRPHIPLPRGGKRWKRVDAFLSNLTTAPPTTLEELEAQIRAQHHLFPPRWRCLHFRPVEASVTNPFRVLEKLYKEEIMGKPDLETLSEAKETIEREIELATCSRCGEEHGSLPCRPTTHRMIEKGLDRFDREDIAYWLNRVAAELPPTRQALTIQLLGRFGILLAQGRPELASEVKEVFRIANDILTL